MKQIYDRPFLTPERQIDILMSRGLLVTDKEKAIRWLRRIGYYRLTGYLYPFRDANGAFLESASIEYALSLYVFDKKLRLLVLDAIERIEVWDFGMLSRFFSGMQKADQKHIAQLFGVTNPQTMANWLAHINLLRNIAAHHGRLWNRKLVITPSFKGTENLDRLQRWMKGEESRTIVAASIAILDHLVSVIQPESEWSNRMINFLKDFPSVPNISVVQMGLDPSFIYSVTLLSAPCVEVVPGVPLTGDETLSW